MVYVHTILRDVAGLFKVGRLVAYHYLNGKHGVGAEPLPGRSATLTPEFDTSEPKSDR